MPHEIQILYFKNGKVIQDELRPGDISPRLGIVEITDEKITFSRKATHISDPEGCGPKRGSGRSIKTLEDKEVLSWRLPSRRFATAYRDNSETYEATI